MRRVWVLLLALICAHAPVHAQDTYNSRLNDVLEAEQQIVRMGGWSAVAAMIVEERGRNQARYEELVQLYRMASYNADQLEEEYQFPIEPGALDQFIIEHDEEGDLVEIDYDAIREYELERLGVPDREEALRSIWLASLRLGSEAGRFGPRDWREQGERPFYVTTECEECELQAFLVNEARGLLSQLSRRRLRNQQVEYWREEEAADRMRAAIVRLLNCERLCRPVTETAPATPAPEPVDQGPEIAPVAAPVAPVAAPAGPTAVCVLYRPEQLCAVLAPDERDGCAADIATYTAACTAALSVATDPAQNCAAVCRFRGAEARLSDTLLDRVRRSLAWAAADGFNRLLDGQQAAILDHADAQRRGLSTAPAEAALDRVGTDLAQYPARVARGDLYWRPAPEQPDGLLFATCRGDGIDAFVAACEASCASPGAVPECRGGVASALLPGRFAPGFDLVSQ